MRFLVAEQGQCFCAVSVHLVLDLVADSARRSACCCVCVVVIVGATSVDDRVQVEDAHALLIAVGSQVVYDSSVCAKLGGEGGFGCGEVCAVLLGLWFSELDKATVRSPLGGWARLHGVKGAACLV